MKIWIQKGGPSPTTKQFYLPLRTNFSILELINIRLGVLHAVAFADRCWTDSIYISRTLVIAIAILLAVL